MNILPPKLGSEFGEILSGQLFIDDGNGNYIPLTCGTLSASFPDITNVDIPHEEKEWEPLCLGFGSAEAEFSATLTMTHREQRRMYKFFRREYNKAQRAYRRWIRHKEQERRKRLKAGI